MKSRSKCQGSTKPREIRRRASEHDGGKEKEREFYILSVQKEMRRMAMSILFNIEGLLDKHLLSSARGKSWAEKSILALVARHIVQVQANPALFDVVLAHPGCLRSLVGSFARRRSIFHPSSARPFQKDALLRRCWSIFHR